MLVIKSLIALLPLALSAAAAPAGTPDSDAQPKNSGITPAPYNETDIVLLEGATTTGLVDGRAHITFCSDANGRGQCLTWQQKNHCCESPSLFLAPLNLAAAHSDSLREKKIGDFRDDTLKPWNDAISSVYVNNQEGVIWTLWQ